MLFSTLLASQSISNNIEHIPSHFLLTFFCFVMNSRHISQFVALSVAALTLVLLVGQAPAYAQKSSKSSTETASSAVSEKLFSEMKWRNIGPYRGGRSIAVAGHADQPLTYYFGATGGGVWKTTDGGINWRCVSDTKDKSAPSAFKSSSVGALAVAPSDPNVVYCGMGETDIRGNIAMGDGVYRSTDGGETWKHLGLKETHAIGRIVVHPKDPDVVYVAALGHVFGTNKERGVYRSTDGGATWKQVLYKNDKVGAVSLVIDPSNPRVLYTAFWEASRNAWSMSSGGKVEDGSGMYKSMDGGDTWTELTRNPGLPKGVIGKIGLAVSPVNSNLVWACVENENGGLFRSDDAGKTWTRTTDDRNLRQRAWYYSHVYADPKNTETVYCTNVNFLKSVDGGKTFRTIPVGHGDTHDLWIDPNNPQRMILADDGGAEVTMNGGRSWTELDLPTAQFYHVALDNQFPYRIYGDQQDNSGICILSRTVGDGAFAITNKDWFVCAPGESGYIAPHPAKPHLIFSGNYGGQLAKLNTQTGQFQSVSPAPEEVIGEGSVNRKERFQWTYPIVFSPHDVNVMYATSQHVWRTRDEGMTWEKISPDLTRNDKAKQIPSGGPITKDNTGVEVYNDIFTFAESPVEKGILWAGSDCGLIHVSRDDGKTWQNVTPKDLPEAMISLIEPSQFDKGTAYAAVNRYKFDDVKPYIFKTSDYGKTWTRVTMGIPDGAFVRAVREDPNKNGLLYAGTEMGVYVSFNDGAAWQPLQLNLPLTPIHDLAVHKREKDLVVATHGRAFWVLDDLSPLHNIADGAVKSEKTDFVFTPRHAYRVDGGSFASARGGFSVGENPVNGVAVHYLLKDATTKDTVKLEFLDAASNLVIAYSNKQDKKGKAVKEPAEFYENPEAKRSDVVTTNAGMNRFVWDMRMPDATEVPGALLWGGSLAGPKVPPGKYQVRLSIAGKVVNTQSFDVLLDPRSPAPLADIQAQVELHKQILAKASEVNKAVNNIRDVRKQVNGAIERLAGANPDKPNPRAKQFKEAAKPLLDSLAAVENELIQTKLKSSQDILNFPPRLDNKLVSLASYVESADSKPPQAAYETFKELAGRADTHLQRLKPLMEVELPKFNAMAKEQNVPAVMIEAGF
jgi:photosystem II stability/assembly factor-like uncharacterized protein